MTKTELTEIQCGTCGVWHAIPTAMYDMCVEEGGFWHCPNGHSRGYREGRNERDAVRRERDRLKQRTAQLEDDLKSARDSWNTAERELQRHKKRAKAGTCPCCKRTFQNMAAHMRTKHPDFDPSKSEVVPFKRKARGVSP